MDCSLEEYERGSAGLQSEVDTRLHAAIRTTAVRPPFRTGYRAPTAGSMDRRHDVVVFKVHEDVAHAGLSE